jgi:hypothetical protein
MKELLLKLLDSLGFAFWVEIVTENPACTYYFGPFIGKNEAEVAKAGYIEDLQGEGAAIASLRVKRCQPGQLTIYDDREEARLLQQLVSTSSQAV